jgi:hypothetical protein
LFEWLLYRFLYGLLGWLLSRLPRRLIERVEQWGAERLTDCFNIFGLRATLPTRTFDSLPFRLCQRWPANLSLSASITLSERLGPTKFQRFLDRLCGPCLWCGLFGWYRRLDLRLGRGRS